MFGSFVKNKKKLQHNLFLNIIYKLYLLEDKKRNINKILLKLKNI